MLYAEKTLSELAIDLPLATEIFRKNRLDFCCGGRQTLKKACEIKQLNLESIINQLASLEAEKTFDTKESDPGKVTDFIEERYHADLRMRLPELITLANRVEQVHADHPSCPHGLGSLLDNFFSDMSMHMQKEEGILFPLIRQGNGAMASMPIQVMMSEHESHGSELNQIHLLTNDFQPPEGACGTWRALYSGLDRLEAELMEHIHLENNVLFPRVLSQIEK